VAEPVHTKKTQQKKRAGGGKKTLLFKKIQKRIME